MAGDFWKNRYRLQAEIPESTLRDVADRHDGPGTRTVGFYVEPGGARPREKSKIPIPGSHDGGFRQKTTVVFARKSSKIPKSALRDVADASDGPGDRAAVLYVGFGCARPREKSKMRISGSHDELFSRKSSGFCPKTQHKPQIPKPMLPDVADTSDAPGSQIVVLYVDFRWVRPREKSEIQNRPKSEKVVAFQSWVNFGQF